MALTKIISKESYKRSVWKNGLGFTNEIAIFPANASLSQANFLWRLSSAQIEKASPFSMFPNHDRILMVLKGGGIRLIHSFEEGSDDEVVDIPALEPYEFPGDVPSRCELSDGAITDFSIFLKKGEVEPLVQILQLSENENFSWNPEGKWNFAFAIQGSFNTAFGILLEGNTLTAENESIQFESLQSQNKLLLISLG